MAAFVVSDDDVTIMLCCIFSLFGIFSSICFFISMLADNAFSFANLASKGFCPASDSFLNQGSKTFL